MTKTNEYPSGLLMDLSINNPLPIGIRRDGDGALRRADIDIRRNVLITGQRKSGGTTTLLGIYAGLRQCTDATLWGIDCGGLSLAHMVLPSDSGAPNPPMLDWIASREADAQRMINAAMRIVMDRYVRCDKLPVGDQVPAIVLLVDLSDAEPSQRLAAGLTRVARTGPALGVYVVLHTRRATADVFGPGMRDAFGVSIELTHQSGWSAAAAAGLDGPTTLGSALCRPGSTGSAFAFDGYHIDRRRALEIGEATADRQPALDDESAAAAGDDYSQRWVWGTAVDTPLLLKEISAAGSAGQQLIDLVEAHERVHRYADSDAISAKLEELVAAGTLVRVRRPTRRADRYLDPAKSAPREVGTLDFPVSLLTLTRFLNVLHDESGSTLTTDHIHIVDTPIGRRVIVYDRPVHAVH